MNIWCSFGRGTRILQCHGQGCVNVSWGLDDANNPLTTAIVIITLSEGRLGKD